MSVLARSMVATTRARSERVSDVAGGPEIDRKTELQIRVQAPQSSIIFRQLESTEHAMRVEEGESDGGRAQGRRQAGGVR